MLKYPDTAPLPPAAPPPHQHAWKRQGGGWDVRTGRREPYEYGCSCGADMYIERDGANVITITVEPLKTAEVWMQIEMMNHTEEARPVRKVHPWLEGAMAAVLEQQILPQQLGQFMAAIAPQGLQWPVNPPGQRGG